VKVSYRWLSEYIDIAQYTAEQLAEKLTRSGIEVDGIEQLNKGVQHVVVGYVKSCEKHPEADKLHVCVIDAGQAQDLQIVCGAKNIAAGQHVPVALVGATLPNGLKIEKAKLRGVESYGMICSAKELGLSEKLLPKDVQDGIYVLPADTQVGVSVVDVLGIDDQVLELDLTPNRSDCLSMLGVAYEIAAIVDTPIKLPPSQASQELQAGHHKPSASSKIKVQITAQDACAHYAARYIQGVQIKASPLWMQHRLMAAGIRPINNIVDVTNLVMLEYGQPLHAFDADQVKQGQIDVRYARPQEKIVTLDGVERTLEPQMIVIADGSQAIALAGVMGGLHSEVTAQTVNILLESAHFAGGIVRKTSRQFGLRSEASMRFEKEVNREAIIPALNRAAQLIAMYSGGVIAEGIVELTTVPLQPTVIDISIMRINDYVGTELTTDQVSHILTRLNFTFEKIDEKSFRIHVPKRRGDISRDVDIIEEVARLYGYDLIPTTLMSGVTTPGALSKAQWIRRVTRNLMTQQGLHEVITYSLTPPAVASEVATLFANAQPIRLALPMSEERSTLRTSLLPHLMEVARYNRNRSNDDVAIFEIGNVYVTSEATITTLPEEKLLLSILLTGNRQPQQWSHKSSSVDFFDLKGIVDSWLQYLGIKGVSYTSQQIDGFHPGRTAEIRLAQRDEATNSPTHDRVIGTMGQLHPDVQLKLDLRDTYVLELQLQPLIDAATTHIDYKPLPRFPAMTRDIALVISQSVSVAHVEQHIRQVAGTLLESMHVFDVYQGANLGQERKSVAFSLVFRHLERTLLEEEITDIQAKVVSSLQDKFKAELRS
jgi:phenylalanyl-tRNA synthetase beta chain